MYFIGSGALLNNAVQYCLLNGLNVDGVCCPPGDPSSPRLRKQGVTVIECDDPNKDSNSIIDNCRDGIVFSINNKHIIKDDLLKSRVKLFNIHNGLVQHYRGLAEVCIFAALCRGENHYGVTLHQVLPHKKVDTGPVVSQIKFAIGPEDTFASLLKNSLEACQKLFESNVRNIVSNSYQTIIVDTAKVALSYKDVIALGVDSGRARLMQASELGYYAGFFPKLKAMITQIPQQPN